MPQPETTANEALRLEIAAELKAHREARAAIEALPDEETTPIKYALQQLSWKMYVQLPPDTSTDPNALFAELETAIYPIYLKRRNEKA